jgi:EAL domain-containing protein (putative c-di-GMP-specific phosphodiesterase class I)/ActR/RegA family two-component response regulator
MKPVAPGSTGGRKSPEKGRSSLRPVSSDHENDQSLDTLKVLVADDNPFIVGLLVRYLKRLGTATPIEACDGRHALDIVGSTAVDIVLCDLDMPGMDGFEFLRHLAEQKAPPAVVIFSGQDRSIVNSAVQLGRAHGLRMLGSLSKPFTLPSLKALLQQADVCAGAFSGLSFQPLTPDAIRHGLANDAVELAYQPKVTTRDCQVTGVEALLRWRDGDGDLMSPAAVIPIAEQCGLINRLTDMVIGKAMAQHGAWLAEGHHFSMAINVSLLDLDRYDFPEFVLDSARSVGAAPSSIVLEVTESQVMADIARPLEILSRLRLKGVGVAIDDYGTGASALQRLKRIPFTELKIDREFVAGAPEDKATRTMLAAIVRLAKGLRLGLVAEGVETESEWQLVAALGVDAVQGYYVARPMPASDLSGWLARSRSAGQQ